MEETFDILQHNLVPKHIKINEEEKKELLRKYNISLNQLPKIQDSDPVAKILGAKADDIIKIIRKSPTMGESVYYRVVIHA